MKGERKEKEGRRKKKKKTNDKDTVGTVLVQFPKSAKPLHNCESFGRAQRGDIHSPTHSLKGLVFLYNIFFISFMITTAYRYEGSVPVGKKKKKKKVGNMSLDL